ncbi:MAG: Hsp20/alpha crystallin family protein [Bryobacteraceae bacterium]
MSLYVIRKGRGVPAGDGGFWPQSESRDIRLPVGRGINSDGLNLRIAMPAVFEGDFSFAVEERSLLIFGVRREPVGFGEPLTKRYALAYGSFHQRVPLGPGLDIKKLKARFHHGVLDVHIPFAPAAAGVLHPAPSSLRTVSAAKRRAEVAA